MDKINNPTINSVNDLTYIRLPIQMLNEPWVSNADIIVYAFMLNRFNFFKTLQKSYYENIKDIAEGSNQNESTVKRAIKKLQQHSYLTIRKVKVGLGVSNSYDIVDVYSIMEVKSKSEIKQVTKLTPKKSYNEDDSLW
jgi:predicted transcriptional regulator